MTIGVLYVLVGDLSEVLRKGTPPGWKGVVLFGSFLYLFFRKKNERRVCGGLGRGTRFSLAFVMFLGLLDPRCAPGGLS